MSLKVVFGEIEFCRTAFWCFEGRRVTVICKVMFQKPATILVFLFSFLLYISLADFTLELHFRTDQAV